MHKMAKLIARVTLKRFLTFAAVVLGAGAFDWGGVVGVLFFTNAAQVTTK